MLSFQSLSRASFHKPSPFSSAAQSGQRPLPSFLVFDPPKSPSRSPRDDVFATRSDLIADYERSSADAFWSTQSRVLKLHNFRSLSPTLISGLFHQKGSLYPTPLTIWSLKDTYPSSEVGRVLYCVYRTHQEAYETLSLPRSSLFHLTPALEQDLEPLLKLKRVDIKQPWSNLPGDPPVFSHYMSSQSVPLPSPSPHNLDRLVPMRQSSSLSNLKGPAPTYGGDPPALSGSSNSQNQSFPLSTNPPNAKSNFRLGDWICMSPTCGVHNFGRNISCIGCGFPRPTPGTINSFQPGSTFHPPRFPSPRFANTLPPYSHSADTGIQCPIPQRFLPPVPVSVSPTPAPSTYPVLTPSGKQLSVGGKVQNISCNPLSPCFMFWSFNEPLPHPGQIRPALSPAFQPPPILNTGNRGPIEHQPGDWVCQKCNYLNWRRRKVCQTCYPYAEGNGDSISAAVQAERIALLANVLSTDTPNSAPSSFVKDIPLTNPSPSTGARSLELPSLAVAAMQSRNTTLLRSRSQADLLSNSPCAEQPIYQTSGGGGFGTTTPCPLLPSFLQDMVQSPSLSPASSSSADFSIEDYDDAELWVNSPQYSHQLSRKSSSSLTAPSIWKLDGEETKALTGHSEEDI